MECGPQPRRRGPRRVRHAISKPSPGWCCRRGRTTRRLTRSQRASGTPAASRCGRRPWGRRAPAARHRRRQRTRRWRCCTSHPREASRTYRQPHGGGHPHIQPSRESAMNHPDPLLATGSWLTPSWEHATVGDAMSAPAIVCPPGTPLIAVARTMATRHVHAVVAADEGMLSTLDPPASSDGAAAERGRSRARRSRTSAIRCCSSQFRDALRSRPLTRRSADCPASPCRLGRRRRDPN